MKRNVRVNLCVFRGVLLSCKAGNNLADNSPKDQGLIPAFRVFRDSLICFGALAFGRLDLLKERRRNTGLIFCL